MARLDAVSALPLPSPYDFIERYTRRRDEQRDLRAALSAS
jgi:hypothetical protein